MRIRIKSDIPLSEETRAALSDFAYGSAWFDLDGGFRSGTDPDRRQAVELVVTDGLPDGVTASPLAAPIWHFGPEPIPEGTFLLLRDDRGRMHDARSCTQHVGTRHVFGALFRDETGTVWAAHRSDEGHADWPLEQLSAHTPPTMEARFGKILDSLPAMGEFLLTNETPARLAWIAWLSGFGSNPKEGISDPDQDAILSDFLDRVGTLRASGSLPARAHPDPVSDLGPRVVVFDPTIQEHEVLVSLHDWRPDEEVEPGEPGTLDLRLTLRADQILIDAPDGRQLMVELEGDQLRVLAYNDTSEAPASLRIRQGVPVEADASDHLSGIHMAEEGPGS